MRKHDCLLEARRFKDGATGLEGSIHDTPHLVSAQDHKRLEQLKTIIRTLVRNRANARHEYARPRDLLSGSGFFVMPASTHSSLLAAGAWRRLPNCPGRLVWRGDRDATPTDLLGRDAVVRVFMVAAARDPVHVGLFNGGGLISYQHADGAFVHTLNTDEGLARKLEQLGIRLEAPTSA